MDHGTTTPQLIKTLHESFCRTAIPDNVWSDGGPQFTSNMFHQFAQHWGFSHKVSTPHYPQSNGKVETTVKSMKKSSGHHGMGDLSIMISSVGHCCNIGTLPAEMGYPLYRNSTDTLCKTSYQHTADPSPKMATQSGICRTASKQYLPGL